MGLEELLVGGVAKRESHDMDERIGERALYMRDRVLTDQ